MTEHYEPKWIQDLRNWGKEEKGKSNKKPAWERKGEFLFTIIANIAIFYIANHAQGWFPDFFTEGWNTVLWILNISIIVDIICNSILLLFSPKFLYHFLKVIMNGTSIIVMIVTVTLFPFNISDSLTTILKILGLVGTVVVLIATVIEFFKIFVPKRKETE